MDGRLYGLDALRGIAAVVVVAYHIVHIFELWDWDFPGYLAVDFFFMLSGYVMARTYEDRLQSGMAVRSFIRVRVRRLWPTVALGVLLGTPVLFIEYPDVWTLYLVANLFLVPVFAKFAYPANNPAWSILAELFANFIHALVLARASTAALWVAVGASFTFLLVMAYLAGSLDFGATAALLPFALPRILMPYAIGIIMYRTWRDTPPFSLHPAVTISILPALILLIPSAVGDLLFVVAACPLLMIGGLSWRPQSIQMASIAGGMSFPLYAIHYPLLDAARFWPWTVAFIPVLLVGMTPELRRYLVKPRKLSLRRLPK